MSDRAELTPEQEIRRLKAVIERDRCEVAKILNECDKAIAAHCWIRNSRGPYEWDDDRWMAEFGDALDNIEGALKPLRAVARDTSDQLERHEDIMAARNGHI